MESTMRLSVTLYKPQGYPDSSNGGVSTQYDRFALYSERPSDEQLAEDIAVGVCSLLLDKRENLPWAGPIAVPIHQPKGGIGEMFGGCYVGATDSRFREMVGDRRPIPLHDRWESQSTYNRLSH
jgi:hypothetical protein